MTSEAHDDDLTPEARAQFRQLVDSVGVKQFARSLDISPRQVNRMRSGAQPNPVDRLVRSLQAADPDVGDAALDFICQEMGGRFSRSADETDAVTHAIDQCRRAVDNARERTPEDGRLDQIGAALQDLRRHIAGDADSEEPRSSRISFDR